MEDFEETVKEEDREKEALNRASSSSVVYSMEEYLRRRQEQSQGQAAP